MTNKTTEGSQCRTKCILVLRDGVRPEWVFPMLAIGIILFGIFFFEYQNRHLFDEPKLMNCVTHICVVDNQAYLALLPPAVIFSTISLCCFRFARKEIKI